MSQEEQHPANDHPAQRWGIRDIDNQYIRNFFRVLEFVLFQIYLVIYVIWRMVSYIPRKIWRYIFRPVIQPIFDFINNNRLPAIALTLATIFFAFKLISPTSASLVTQNIQQSMSPTIDLSNINIQLNGNIIERIRNESEKAWEKVSAQVEDVENKVTSIHSIVSSIHFIVKSSLTDKLKHFWDEFNSQQKRIDDIEAEITTQQTRMDNMDAELLQQLQKINQHQGHFEKLHSKHSEHGNLLEGVGTDVSDYRKNFNQIQEELSSHQSQLKQLETKKIDQGNELIDEDVSKQEKELKQVKQNIIKQQSLFDYVKSIFFIQQKQLEQAKQDISKQQEQLNKVQRSISDHQIQLNQVKASVSGNKDNRKGVDDEVYKCEELMYQMKNEISNHEDEVEQVKLDIYDHKQRLDSHQDQLKKIETSLTNQKDQTKHLTDEVSDCQSQLIIVNRAIHKHRAQFHDHEKQLYSVQTSFQDQQRQTEEPTEKFFDQDVKKSVHLQQGHLNYVDEKTPHQEEQVNNVHDKVLELDNRQSEVDEHQSGPHDSEVNIKNQQNIIQETTQEIFDLRFQENQQKAMLVFNQPHPVKTIRWFWGWYTPKKMSTNSLQLNRYLPDFDYNNKHDYADINNNAVVIMHETSSTWVPNTGRIQKVIGFVSQEDQKQSKPEMAISSKAKIEEHWSMNSNAGHISIAFHKPIFIQAITIEYHSNTIDFAPKLMDIYGIIYSKHTYSYDLIGSIYYVTDDTRGPMQTFDLTEYRKQNNKAYDGVRVKVLSNWGSTLHTDIYRIRAYGEPSYQT